MKEAVSQYTMANTMQTFIVIVAIFGIVFGVSFILSTYPCSFFVNRIHHKALKDVDKYYFYYQKATAYRMLYIVHTFLKYVIKLLGATMTFITVYCAIDNNGYLLLCSLVAAMCELIGLSIPIEKYIKIYVEAARVMELELNTEHIDEKEEKQKLKEAYEKAEKIISQDYV